MAQTLNHFSLLRVYRCKSRSF